MTKRQVILSAVVAALLSVSSIAVAVEFGPDSANITHRYFPVETGAWQVKLGAGNWTGRVMTTHAVGIDTVSGAQIGAQTFNDVKCLKVNLIHTELNGTDEFDTIWFAQDTEGNVWLLKIYFPIDDTAYTLGTVFASWLMPAVPAIGVRAGVTIPETQSDYCEIVDVSISVNTNYGSYINCIKVNCFHQSVADEVEYYCPDVGNVRISNVANPPDVMDLKEHGTATVTKTTTVVIPLMD